MRLGGMHGFLARRHRRLLALPGLRSPLHRAGASSNERLWGSSSCAGAWRAHGRAPCSATGLRARAARLSAPASGRVRGRARPGRQFGLGPELVEMHARYGEGVLARAARRRLAVPRAFALRWAEPARKRHGPTVRPRSRLAQRRTRVRQRAAAPAPRHAGFALGQSIPLLLRGPRMASWSPSGCRCPMPICSSGWRGCIAAIRCWSLFTAACEAQAMMEGRVQAAWAARRSRSSSSRKAAGEFLGKPDGPRVATIDFGGWDTPSASSASTAS